MPKIFTIDTVAMVETQLQMLNFPYINAYHSTLGGNENVSILLTISKDPIYKWYNMILENSTYAKIRISNDGVVEQFSGNHLKLRRFKAKSVSEVIKKINNIKIV